MADNNIHNILLVEGSDEAHVFHHLSKHYQIRDKFSIKPKLGVNNLLDNLDVELLQADLERLGIVVDADANLNNRWQALQNILKKAGIVQSLPEAPDPNGTISTT